MTKTQPFSGRGITRRRTGSLALHLDMLAGVLILAMFALSIFALACLAVGIGLAAETGGVVARFGSAVMKCAIAVSALVVVIGLAAAYAAREHALTLDRPADRDEQDRN